MRLRLLTLNLHCLEEDNILYNIELIVKEIMSRNIDIVFFQEVAQYKDDSTIKESIKQSNLGYRIYETLKQKGKHYYFDFEPIKESFDKYDEGLALLSKYKLFNRRVNVLSSTDDYFSWLRRKSLKSTIEVEETLIDLVSVHLGWNQGEERYLSQLDKLMSILDNKQTLIGGDFNVSFKSKEYYQTINKGLVDLYGENPYYHDDTSFEHQLDIHKKSSRIDYIFALEHYTVCDQKILFMTPKVSDHYGVYIEVKI